MRALARTYSMEHSAPELRERAEAQERATTEFLRVKRAKLARERATTRSHGDARVARQQERERANRASAAASRAKIVCYARELERRTDRLELDRNRHCARADRAERKLAVLREEARRLKSVLRALWERKHPDTCAYLVDSNALFLLASQAEADSDPDEPPGPDTAKPEPAMASAHPSPLPPPRLSPSFPHAPSGMRPELHAPPSLPPPHLAPSPLGPSQNQHSAHMPPPARPPQPPAHLGQSPLIAPVHSPPPPSSTAPEASSVTGSAFYMSSASRPQPSTAALMSDTAPTSRGYTLPHLVREPHGGGQQSAAGAIGGPASVAYSTTIGAFSTPTVSYSAPGSAYSAPIPAYSSTAGAYSAVAQGYQDVREGQVFASSGSPVSHRRAYVLPPPPPDRAAATTHTAPRYEPIVSAAAGLTNPRTIDLRYIAAGAPPGNMTGLVATAGGSYVGGAASSTKRSSFPPMRVREEEARRGEAGESR